MNIRYANRILSCLSLLWLAGAGGESGHAQTASTFTYQGRLTDNGQAASGTYDLRFSLFGAQTGGSALGTPIVKENVEVLQGVFTVGLDFGVGNFQSGNPRWLQIGVRPGSSVGVFTDITPRQALSAAPYALFALNGTPGPQGPKGDPGDSRWAIAGANIWFSTEAGGRVGIGTSTPGAALDVRGSVNIQNGVALDGADKPMITRAWDPFTDGPNAGLGRWGLFMEPFNLVLGIPQIEGRGLEIAKYNDRGVRSALFTIDQQGNVVIAGDLSQLSDRNRKEELESVAPREILEKVAMLPISLWNYTEDADGVQHIGPMAQDFYAAFGLGRSDKQISALDADGVALSAIQGLYELIEEKDSRIAALEKRLLKLEKQAGRSFE